MLFGCCVFIAAVTEVIIGPRQKYRLLFFRWLSFWAALNCGRRCRRQVGGWRRRLHLVKFDMSRLRPMISLSRSLCQTYFRFVLCLLPYIATRLVLVSSSSCSYNVCIYDHAIANDCVDGCHESEVAKDSQNSEAASSAAVTTNLSLTCLRVCAYVCCYEIS